MSEQNIFKHTPHIEREEEFRLMSEIYHNPDLTQRELSTRMKMSLGKTNYMLNSLLRKGLLKISNFSSRNGKLRKIHYMMTPSGIEAKIRLTWHFLKQKEMEYARLKEEWEQIQSLKV